MKGRMWLGGWIQQFSNNFWLSLTGHFSCSRPCARNFKSRISPGSWLQAAEADFGRHKQKGNSPEGYQMDHRIRGGYRSQLRNGQKLREVSRQKLREVIQQRHMEVTSQEQPDQDTTTGVAHTGHSLQGCQNIEIPTAPSTAVQHVYLTSCDPHSPLRQVISPPFCR